MPSTRASLALIVALSSSGVLACRGGGSGDADSTLAAPHGFPAPPTTPYEVIDVADGGMISGTVRVEAASARDTTIRPTNDVAVCGNEYEERRLQVTGGRIEGAVVWLHDIRSGKRLPRERLFEVHHVRCRLAPRLQAVTTGGTLNVRSADPVSHRTRFVHEHTGGELDIVRQIDAGSVVPTEKVVQRAGLVHLRCEVHPWATAWIAVFDHPYFATTDAGGNFTFTEVPPGRYVLVAWHDQLGAIEREVVVGTGTTVQAELIYR